MLTTERTTARAADVAWIPRYILDLEADFARFYGELDPLTLPGPRFLRLASRLPAYDGVMRARVEGLWAAETVPAPPPLAEAPAVRETRTPSGDVVREIAPNRDALAKSSLAGVIEMG